MLMIPGDSPKVGSVKSHKLPHLFPTFLYHTFNFVKEWERRMAVLCSKKGSADLSWKGWLLKWHTWLALIWVHESNNDIFTHKRRKRVADESSISLHIVRVLALHVPRTIPKGYGNWIPFLKLELLVSLQSRGNPFPAWSWLMNHMKQWRFRWVLSRGELCLSHCATNLFC
jgi:hypothetical protein